MKRLLTFFTLILSVTLLMGQELTVKNFALDPTDLTASTQRRNDNNGDACALIKVQLARPGAEFLGNVMGDTPYNKSEYFVYMMKGSKMLQVKLDGYLPVKINFTDYGYSGLESLSTYVLSITLPNVVGQSVDDGKNYFSIAVTPPNAVFILDGEPMNLDSDGVFSQRLMRGKHRYQIKAIGYSTEQGEFDLGMEKVSLRKTLKSSLAQLTIECPTLGVDFYVNDEKMGSGTSWTGSVKAGDYLVEARKMGHITQQKSITLADNQTLKVNLPALVARVGQLDVNFKPLDAEVWIDGAKVGTSPDLFKNVTIGSHRIEIHKEGYQSETKTVTIAEGQTATLSGSLAATASTSSTSSTANVTSTANSSVVSGTTQDRQTFTVNGVSFTMVRVEGGTFTMGATKEQDSDAWDTDNEKPAHQVTLSTYSIGETEVTQELWEAVMGSNPSEFKGSKRPVEHVSWNDCQDFIRKLNAATGQNFRLPTEAEWEYAARGGSKSKGYKYAGSNNIKSVAWYDNNSWKKGESSPDYGTHNVATKHSNELGLYDMSGNVEEWCSDWYGKDYYSSSSQTNPGGLSSGKSRVCRGGSWGIYAEHCRSSRRNSYDPDIRGYVLGLRLVLSEEPNQIINIEHVKANNPANPVSSSNSLINVRGTIKDSNGTPISGIVIHAQSSGKTGYSDRDGNFEIPGATQGETLAVITAEKTYYQTAASNVAFVIQLRSNQITVKGIVVDKKDEPMVGASIFVKGSTNGTMADIDGNFTLTNVPNGALLEIIYIGYKTKTVPAASSMRIVIKK